MALIIGGTPPPFIPKPPGPNPPRPVTTPAKTSYKDVPHPIGPKLLPPVNNLHTPGHPVDRGGSRGYAGITGHSPYNPITDNHIIHAIPPHMGGMNPTRGK